VNAVAIVAAVAHAQERTTPEERAIAYLSAEVPRWSAENGCFSCHNNGDGARALFAARKGGYKVTDAALADTTGWLLEPAKWDDKIADAVFKDKKLARIQFAASLAAAVEAGVIEDRGALTAAAASLVPLQDADGAWHVDPNLGSPATYGDSLATWLSKRTLEAAGQPRFATAIRRAGAWLRSSRPQSILDSAVVLLAAPETKDRLLSQILRAQTSSGGWGPYALTPPEPFDTAVALLAIKDMGASEAIRRGRTYLIANQLDTGGWPETTRPAGARSYAQHISTSAWAALALLSTNGER
jgi:hypothetical protein